jgi:hypothetical protein
MARGDRRRCLCCRKLFRPDPRNRRHQRYCSMSRCRAASKAASQARWLAAPDNQKSVVTALLGRANMSAEPSQAGRLADRLIERLQGLEGARVLKIRGVRHLIARLGAHEGIERGAATNEIFNKGQFTDHETLYIEPREHPKLTTQDVFDFLLRREFFRAGLELYCEHCRLLSWLSLRQIDDAWVCEFCGHQNLTNLQLRSRGDWKFRKSGLLTKDNNQEGAIPVLLSLLAFKQIFESNLLYATSLNLKVEGVACEADFFAVCQEDGDVISCAIGEAKSEGGSINATEVANKKQIHAALHRIGVRPYPSFAKTAAQFSPEEVALFRSLKVDGIQPILLANSELEAYHAYQELPVAGGGPPDPPPFSFDELARCSERRYLREE